MRRVASCSVALLALSASCVHDARPELAAGADAVGPARRTGTPRPRPQRPAPSPRALVGRGPGFPESGPWLSFYGNAAQMGDLGRAAQSFRILDVDADPGDDGVGNFTDEQLRVLRGGGRNRVLSYLNLGSCERFRTYWLRAPAPFVSCAGNRAAQLGTYEGYPDETWMDLGNAEYQRLLLEYVAPRLAARGVDGFYLDNLELAEHDAPGSEGWCSPACRRGALDLVRRLRESFPDKLLVMQNATGDVTRLGVTGGVAFPLLLDGVTHEEVYSPRFDANAERELLAWKALDVRSKTGRPMFLGVEDYVGDCANATAAKAAYGRSKSHGFSPYASDASGSQKVVCYWPF